MEYINRTYREHFQQGRWKHFVVKHKETDLWIGIDVPSFRENMPGFIEEQIRHLRMEMDTYLLTDPGYTKALVPYSAAKNAPAIFQEMSAAGQQSGIGPMSAVAGAVAKQVARILKAEYRVKEVIVENGGDIYADIQEDMDISIFAGPSPLSEKVGLHIEASQAPLGICTSSGTVGPSLSFGKADAVMIISRDVLLADSYATAFANQIQTAADIDGCIERIGKVNDIISAMIIKDDKLGIVGCFELKIF